MKLINQPKTERGEKTLLNIIEAAEIVFSKKGYNKATVKDISNEAGVSVGTIYIYFTDKKSIYDYLLSQYSHYIRYEIARRTEKLTDRRSIEREGVLVFLEIVREKKHIYNIIWESLYIDKQKFIDYYMNFASSYNDSMQRAVDKGEIRDDIDIECLSWMLMGVSNFLGLRYVMFDDKADLDEVADHAIEIMERGMFNNN